TTPEEYGEQRYEGGHTLYGPATQPFAAAHAARLAARTVRDGLVCDAAPERAFDLHHRAHLPTAAGPAVEPALDGPAAFTDATARAGPVWEQRGGAVARGGLAWHEPLVRVEMADGPDGPWVPAVVDGRRVDEGCDLEVVHLGPGERGHRYAVRWWDPAFRAGRRHRFVLVAQSGRPGRAGGPGGAGARDGWRAGGRRTDGAAPRPGPRSGQGAGVDRWASITSAISPAPRLFWWTWSTVRARPRRRAMSSTLRRSTACRRRSPMIRAGVASS